MRFHVPKPCKWSGVP